MERNLIVLGPQGVGKSRLIQELLKDFKRAEICTTSVHGTCPENLQGLEAKTNRDTKVICVDGLSYWDIIFIMKMTTIDKLVGRDPYAREKYIIRPDLILESNTLKKKDLKGIPNLKIIEVSWANEPSTKGVIEWATEKMKGMV